VEVGVGSRRDALPFRLGTGGGLPAVRRGAGLQDLPIERFGGRGRLKALIQPGDFGLDLVDDLGELRGGRRLLAAPEIGDPALVALHQPAPAFLSIGERFELTLSRFPLHNPFLQLLPSLFVHLPQPFRLERLHFLGCTNPGADEQDREAENGG
jgi:hypothetical protein